MAAHTLETKMAKDLEWRNLLPEDAMTYDFERCWTRNHPDDPIRPIDLVAALYFTRSNLYKCAALLRRKRKSLVQFLERNIDIQEVRYEIFDSTLDQLENDVITSALGGDAQDRRFVLSTLGKDRGFSTRAQVSGPNDGPIPIEAIEWSVVDPRKSLDDDASEPGEG